MSDDKSQFTKAKEVMDEVYEDLDLSGIELVARSFESCVFINCNFTNASIHQSEFVDCKFTTCNMTNVSLTGSSFSDIAFVDSKLFGVEWSEAELTENLVFDHCQADSASTKIPSSSH